SLPHCLQSNSTPGAWMVFIIFNRIDTTTPERYSRDLPVAVCTPPIYACLTFTGGIDNAQTFIPDCACRIHVLVAWRLLGCTWAFLFWWAGTAGLHSYAYAG